MDRYSKYHNRNLNVEFSRILDEELIYILFQPIVDLNNGRILGYEALCRGPKQSPLHTPDILFQTAESTNKVIALDDLARKKAIELFTPFLNLRPSQIASYDFFKTEAFAQMKRNNISFSNIVLEITEQCPISYISNYKALFKDLKTLGVKIALDDVGAGYSGLKTILDIEPDYLKIDMELVKDIHKTPLKRNLMKGLVNLSNYCNMKIIAEGIECREELQTIIELGVYGAQGYFLQRPLETPQDLLSQCKALFSKYFEDYNSYSL